MSVGEAVSDPETRAVIELVQTLAPATLRQTAHWEQTLDWSAGDLAIEVRSWSPRVDVVSRALTAVDEYWRLATALASAEPAESAGLRLRDLIDDTPGLTVINTIHGSFLVRLNDVYRKRPLATLGVIAALLGGSASAGDTLVHAAEVVIEHIDSGDGAGGPLTSDVDLSDDTREVLRKLPQLPPGTEATIVLRVVSPSLDASATVRIRPGQQPRSEPSFGAVEPLGDATYEPGAPPAPVVDPIEQLRELAALHKQGILTDEEFEAQKWKILG